jgi:PAS domain S-box-containing protein
VATLGDARRDGAAAEPEALAALVAQLDAYVGDPVLVTETVAAPPAESRIRWCNAAFEEMTGWRLGELRGRSPVVLRGPGTDPATVARIIERRAANLPVREELLNYRKDGEPFWVEITIRAAVKGPDGRLLSVSVQRDVTAAKRREEALRTALDAESLLAAVVESVDAEVQILDPADLRFVRVNGQAVRKLGWQGRELREMRWTDVVVGADEGGMRQAASELLAGKTGPVRLRYRQRRRGGGDYPVAATATLLLRSGRPLIVAVVTDLSEAEAARARVAEAERRYALSRAASLDGCWELEIETLEKAFSDRNREMLGYSVDEFPDELNSWRQSVHPEDGERVAARLRAHIETDCGFDETYRMRRKNGGYAWWRSRATVWRGEDGRPIRVIGVNSDVTELVEARRTAEEAARLKAGFLAKMSHEIRTPLNGVLGMAELMRLSETDPEKLARLEAIASSGRSLLTIIDDVLALARLDAGREPPRMAEFDLRALCERALDPVRAIAAEKGLALRVRAPDGRFLGDERRLRQILINLLGNATKFTDRGEVVIEARAAAGRLRFSVCDTGPGVPVHLREAIFEPFRQGDDSPTRRHGGLGLGLAIAREMVRGMGGELTVDDRAGGGARFRFEANAAPA